MQCWRLNEIANCESHNPIALGFYPIDTLSLQYERWYIQSFSSFFFFLKTYSRAIATHFNPKKKTEQFQTGDPTCAIIYLIGSSSCAFIPDPIKINGEKWNERMIEWKIKSKFSISIRKKREKKSFRTGCSWTHVDSIILPKKFISITLWQYIVCKGTCFRNVIDCMWKMNVQTIYVHEMWTKCKTAQKLPTKTYKYIREIGFYLQKKLEIPWNWATFVSLTAKLSYDCRLFLIVYSNWVVNFGCSNLFELQDDLCGHFQIETKKIDNWEGGEQHFVKQRRWET